MATAAKPGAGAKQDATENTDAPPAKKSKKMLFIIIAVSMLLIGGGATAYLLMKPAHTPFGAGTLAKGKNVAANSADEATDEATDAPTDEAAKEEAGPEKQPKYVALGTFTANLIYEQADRYLQVAISIKVSNPELEEKLKLANPEILHYVNMLLQSKRPSELATLEGKEKLAGEIKSVIERILGLVKPPITNSSIQTASAPAASEPKSVKTGIEAVLFTAFIIQ